MYSVLSLFAFGRCLEVVARKTDRHSGQTFFFLKCVTGSCLCHSFGLGRFIASGDEHGPLDSLFVGWLLNVPATCECISGTDLHRQFYVLPH